MEFEDQEVHEEEVEEGEEGEEEEEEEMELSYDKLGNSDRAKMTTSPGGIVNNKPRYRECLKNHAAGIGGHAVDGCCEFMAAGAEGTLDALKCAACNCHRNFHRKEATDLALTTGGGEFFFHGYSHSHRHLQLPQFTPYYRTPAGYLHVAPQQQRPLTFPSTSDGHGREDQEDISNNPIAGEFGGVGSGGSSRKRFRTKFTQEQKEKMLGLAETLGWRIQKHDEDVVQQFCNENGVKRHVLKVWMHNNKHTIERGQGGVGGS